MKSEASKWREDKKSRQFVAFQRELPVYKKRSKCPGIVWDIAVSVACVYLFLWTLGIVQ